MSAANLVESTDEEFQNVMKFLDFDAYSGEELANLSEELERRVDLIALETEIFDSYMTRVNPSQKEEDLSVEAKDDDRKDAKKDKKKGDKVKELDRALLLSIEQKTDISTRELEEFRDKTESDKEEWVKNADIAKVQTN